MKISGNKKWILAAAGAVALFGVGLPGAFYVSHHDSTIVSPETADAEFLKLRARFADQRPLLDMAERQAQSENRSLNRTEALRSFHIVIFDRRGEERLVHMTVPYWFVKLFPLSSGHFQWLGQLTFLDDTEFDPEAIRLTLSEIEQHGPGLLVDFRHPGGGQFIAWTE